MMAEKFKKISRQVPKGQRSGGSTSRYLRKPCTEKAKGKLTFENFDALCVKCQKLTLYLYSCRDKSLQRISESFKIQEA